MNSVVIHNNNIDLFLFKNRIKFDSSNDIDKYISDEIIPKLLESDFDRIFIKDNLSANYLELLGLRVAYHIRLSQELGEKRFSPIIILSDLDSDTLNKFDPMARILFTKNVFIASNTKDGIEKFKIKELKNLTEDEYREKFLNLIDIETPKDYTDHHDITNEWAIYQWSNTLKLTTDAIDLNHHKISSMLYFKYLQAKNQAKEDKETKKLLSPKEEGKVLFVDDEWAKGWSDVMGGLYDNYSKIKFKTFKYDFKDKSELNLFLKIKESVEKFNPDVVILDLRLSQNDHNKNLSIDDFLGMDILKKIHAINEGIQVIMLTATSKSSILEKLYEKKILGYIKKEHPADTFINTTATINKFVSLVDKGLERSYLKDIFVTKSKIENILENNIFAQYISDKEKYDKFWIQLQVEITQVFDILSNSSSPNKFKYAMVSIASSLEAILSIFIIDVRNHDNKYWDGEICRVNTLNTKLRDLFYDKFGYAKKDMDRKELNWREMISKRNDYLHSRRKVEVSKIEIVGWFKKFLKMIEIIENPPNLRRYDADNMVQNLNDAFNNR